MTFQTPGGCFNMSIDGQITMASVNNEDNIIIVVKNYVTLSCQ